MGDIILKKTTTEKDLDDLAAYDEALAKVEKLVSTTVLRMNPAQQKWLDKVKLAKQSGKKDVRQLTRELKVIHTSLTQTLGMQLDALRKHSASAELDSGPINDPAPPPEQKPPVQNEQHKAFDKALGRINNFLQQSPNPPARLVRRILDLVDHVNDLKSNSKIPMTALTKALEVTAALLESAISVDDYIIVANTMKESQKYDMKWLGILMMSLGLVLALVLPWVGAGLVASCVTSTVITGMGATFFAINNKPRGLSKTMHDIKDALQYEDTQRNYQHWQDSSVDDPLLVLEYKKPMTHFS